jgi:hypothetical protein
MTSAAAANGAQIVCPAKKRRSVESGKAMAIDHINPTAGLSEHMTEERYVILSYHTKHPSDADLRRKLRAMKRQERPSFFFIGLLQPPP